MRFGKNTPLTSLMFAPSQSHNNKVTVSAAPELPSSVRPPSNLELPYVKSTNLDRRPSKISTPRYDVDADDVQHCALWLDKRVIEP